ncbi:MAG: NAD(P)/FAD-dependent oxidoreductase [Eubacterium sp.]
MKVIIIGAGAAGLTAAIKAAECGASVTVLEHENKPGKKILITGNGKCNITNTNLSADKYYGKKEFIEKVIRSFNCRDTITFFENMGVVTKDKNGYIYPMSDQASTVLNTLRDTALNMGVSIKTNNSIERIEKSADGFDIHIGILLHCDKLIIATGGKSFPKTGATGEGYRWAETFGHRIITPKPALTALICKNTGLSKASGVRTRAKISVINHGTVSGSDMGEIQITDYGVSGIPVFNVSRLADTGSKLTIDFMPDLDFEYAEKLIKNIMKNRWFMSVSSALNGYFNDRLIHAILDSSNIDRAISAKKITKGQIHELTCRIKEYTVEVKSRRGFEFAQVTQGGIDTDEIDGNTMESKLIHNLYFAGEIMNVDGICGGYNLQFAWSTGMIAGGNCHQ